MERQNQKRKERRRGPVVQVDKKIPVDREHRKTKWCSHCCGIPDARVSNRPVNDNVGSPMVANWKGICNGCGLPWAPAPPIPRGPSIRSSAGTAAKDSMFYGVRINNQATGTERKKDK
jgi:hypothetical protein